MHSGADLSDFVRVKDRFEAHKEGVFGVGLVLARVARAQR